MSAYTPGPWEWTNEFRSEDGRETWTLIHCKTHFHGIMSCDGIGNSPNHLNAANACLIAAAPELLEALEYAAALIGGIAKIAPEISGLTMTAKNKDTGEKHPTSFLQIVDAVTSAIAKAKGETP